MVLYLNVLWSVHEVLRLLSRTLLQLHFKKLLSGRSEEIKKWDFLLQENSLNCIQYLLLIATLRLAMKQPPRTYPSPLPECSLTCAGDKLSLEVTVVPHDIDIGLQTYFD